MAAHACQADGSPRAHGKHTASTLACNVMAQSVGAGRGAPVIVSLQHAAVAIGSTRGTALNTARQTLHRHRHAAPDPTATRPRNPTQHLVMHGRLRRFGASLRSAPVCSETERCLLAPPLSSHHIAGCEISFQRLVHACSSYYHACYCCTLRTPWGCRRVLRSKRRHRRANLALTLTCPPGRRS